MKKSVKKLLKKARAAGMNVGYSDIAHNYAEFQRALRDPSRAKTKRQKEREGAIKGAERKLAKHNKKASWGQKLYLDVPQNTAKENALKVVKLIDAMGKPWARGKRLKKNKKIAEQIIKIVYPNPPKVKLPEREMSISYKSAQLTNALRKKAKLPTVKQELYRDNLLRALLRTGNIDAFAKLSKLPISIIDKLRLNGFDILEIYFPEKFMASDDDDLINDYNPREQVNAAMAHRSPKLLNKMRKNNAFTRMIDEDIIAYLS